MLPLFKKNIIHVVFLLVLFGSFSCNSTPERDKIQFDIPVSEVQNAMLRMNNIMEKLKEADKQPRIVSWFFPDYESFETIDINGARFPFDSLNVNDLDVFEELTSIEKNDFYHLIKFFVTNEITSCSKQIFPHNMSTAYHYDYRNYRNSNEAYYLRTIIVKESANDISTKDFEQYYSVLDEKHDLVLIKFSTQ